MRTEERLLVIACSQRKRSTPDLLPAIERYDGPAFRVLRHFLSEQFDAGLTTYVLSANFGLIPAVQSIPNYNCCMTRQRAETLRLPLLSKLQSIAESGAYQKMCLCVGSHYSSAMHGYEKVLPSSLAVTLASGGTGKRLSRLHTWLRSSEYKKLPIAQTGRALVRLCNTDYSLTTQQVFEVAHQALIAGEKGAKDYITWYVDVDGERVSPKWLVSKLTGCSVSKFHTDAARRFLHQCGVEVRQS